MKVGTSLCLIVFCGVFLPGCAGDSGGMPWDEGTPPPPSAQNRATSENLNQDSARPQSDLNKPIAFIDGQPVQWGDISNALLEAQGAQVLGELVLEQRLNALMARRGLKTDDQAIDHEQSYLLESLSDNADQAQRLLNELRDRRGLGKERYQRFLRNRAMMRALVRDDAVVTDTAIRQAYELRFGPLYEVRIIVTPNLSAAADAVRRARAGETFSDLAVAVSTDSSRSQGGLLSPLSLEDPTYPKVVRDVIRALSPGQVSDPVSLESGYAVVKLERKIERKQPPFDDVKDELALSVRRNVEDLLMQQLARSELTQAQVVPMNPALAKGWKSQKVSIQEQ
ncbi:MAG: hypothetical protein GC164_09850 [Phycisphaera sp.]|nr:hypothetical protein [Phycisphaera sp.]